EVDVVGGDSFLRLRAEPGTEVVVLGYEGEPYLRYLPDGSVEENRRSPATVLNRTRYGAGGELSATDPPTEPERARVAGGGTYWWHDHRIHLMSEAEPPSLAGADSGKIQDWSLDVVVDGAPVVVHGELTREPSPSPWPWLGLAVVAGAATFAAG